MRKLFFLCLFSALSFPAYASGTAAPDPNADVYRSWITEMKGQERGPFSRIRWFCADGTVLPPRPYACRDHGGNAAFHVGGTPAIQVAIADDGR